MELRRAGEGDIPFIMAAERGPGFEQLVGQGSEAQHRAFLADDGNACLIASRDGTDGGFMLLSGLNDRHNGVNMKRIVAAKPDGGFGTAMVRAGLDWVFGMTKTHRVWLDTLRHNERAAHVYRKLGFVDEGVFRNAWQMPDGSYCDRLMMSVLRAEWAAIRAADRTSG